MSYGFGCFICFCFKVECLRYGVGVLDIYNDFKVVIIRKGWKFYKFKWVWCGVGKRWVGVFSVMFVGGWVNREIVEVLLKVVWVLIVMLKLEDGNVKFLKGDWVVFLLGFMVVG